MLHYTCTHSQVTFQSSLMIIVRQKLANGIFNELTSESTEAKKRNLETLERKKQKPLRYKSPEGLIRNTNKRVVRCQLKRQISQQIN